MLVLTVLLVLSLCGIASARVALVAVSLPPYVDVDTFVGVDACVVASAVFVLVCYTGRVVQWWLVAVSLPPYVEEEDFPPAASKPPSDNRHSHSQETFSIFMELWISQFETLYQCQEYLCRL